jgi:hypothetical protein
MEDREQAVQYWLNKDGKKRYGLATVRKRFRFVRTSTVSLETSKSPTPTDQENDRLYAKFIEARQNKLSLRTIGMWKQNFNSMFVVQIEYMLRTCY